MPYSLFLYFDIIIHADREIPVKTLNRILEIQNGIQETKIFLAIKDKSRIVNDSELRMIEFNKTELSDTTMTIQQWLK